MEAPAATTNELRQRKTIAAMEVDVENPLPRGLFSRERATPPDDDICPICFGAFHIACKTNCGHWFCANCILLAWYFSNEILPCKCPMCSQSIRKLTPEASLTRSRDGEIVEMLNKVKKYNRTFGGGVQGFTMKLNQLPLLLTHFAQHQLPVLYRRAVRQIMDSDQMLVNYMIARMVAFFMTLFYEVCGFEFIPGGFMGETLVFEVGTVGVIIIAQAVSIYRSIMIRRRIRLARQANANLHL